MSLLKDNWNVGDVLAHRYNRELGAGRVVSREGRNLVVEFPDTGKTLPLAAGSDALEPIELMAGSRARYLSTGEMVKIESFIDEVTLKLVDGREAPIELLWPVPGKESPVERLARGSVDGAEDFINRLDALRLLRLREADGLGSFLGGRIRLFPHQLYAADRAVRTDPVRWLLADEVGLGKTVEACLIMNRLIHTGRAERTLVVAPETLTLQWLGELWRKYHQIFVLIDEKRLKDVAKDYGKSFNPFEVHRRAIVGLETLVANPRLTDQAVEAGINLLVIDEAHHLRRPHKHPGNEQYRAVAPIVGLGNNVLLLTATPMENDIQGFFRLLQLLRPEEFPENEAFERRLANRRPLPPCTSNTRRVDIGGLPPRVPRPVLLPGMPPRRRRRRRGRGRGRQDRRHQGRHPQDRKQEIETPQLPTTGPRWSVVAELEAWARRLPAENRSRQKSKAELVWRALSSPKALMLRVRNASDSLKKMAEEAERDDPRIAWLVEKAKDWRKAGDKTLVFVAHRPTLEALKRALEKGSPQRIGIFHEHLSPERRDIEVAQFRMADGPSMLISTECGGEGRNFQFCKRLVLFDLPWNPTVVEQRIGRLDRIGRTEPTEIVYFKPPTGLGRSVVELYEALGIFEEPVGVLEQGLRHVQKEIKKASLRPPIRDFRSDRPIGRKVFQRLVDTANQARQSIEKAAYHELHRAPYRAEMVDGILDRVPPELDSLTESVVRRAAERFGFEVEQQSGKSTWLIEFGSQALLDHLPGVPAGKRFLGTFDRQYAVDVETLDFFANGHPLVEGILEELEEGDRGRVGTVQIKGEQAFFGLLALYKEGPDLEVIVVDGDGNRRDDLAERFTTEPLALERFPPEKWTSQTAWKKTISKLAEGLPADREPKAVAAIRIRRVGAEASAEKSVQGAPRRVRKAPESVPEEAPAS